MSPTGGAGQPRGGTGAGLPPSSGAGTPRDGDPCDKFGGPSNEDRARWNKLMRPKSSTSPSTEDERAIDRFLRSPAGRDLLAKLSDGFERLGADVTVEISFSDRVAEGTAGEVTPKKPVVEADDRRMTYSAKVGRSKDRSTPGPVDYPRTGTGSFSYKYKDGVSEMASTIFHEIQHVYFLNQYYIENPAEADGGGDESVSESWSVSEEEPQPVTVSDSYGHGEGDAAKDPSSYDPRFLGGLKGFARDMDDLEDCNKSRAPRSVPTPTGRGAGTPR